MAGVTSRAVRLAGLAALCLMLATAWAGSAPGGRVDAAFREACDLYERGDFSGALAGFETMRSQGVKNAAVYFNLGNCYYKQNQVGRSIVNYRRALSLAPRDGDVRANLGLARASVRGGDAAASRSPGLSALPLRVISPRQAQALFYAAYYLGAVFFLGVLFLEARLRRQALYGLVVAVMVAAAAFGLSRYGASRLASLTEAVVVADRAELKSGPGDAFEQISILPDGLEIEVRARSGMWVEVTLSTNEVGWLRDSDLETISISSG